MNQEELLEMIETLRPEPRRDIGQYSIDSVSLRKRISKLREYLSEGRVLMIGDDDLASLILSKDYEVTVIDLDKRYLDIIEEDSLNSDNVSTTEFDLKNTYRGDYPPLEGKFDAFVTDPPYSFDGMKIFVGTGINFLKKNGVGLIACYYNLNDERSLEVTKEVTEFILNNGCVVERIIPYFQYTPSSDKYASLMAIRKLEEVEKIDYNSLRGKNKFY